MNLELPKLTAQRDLAERVTYLERYLYRLVTQLQAEHDAKGA